MTDMSKKRFDPRQAGAVMKALIPFLAVGVKPLLAATAVLEAVHAKPRDHKFKIKRKADGSEILMLQQDKGDIVPGFDKDMNRYEAYTSYFEWPDADANGGKRLLYSQVDKWTADASGNVDAYRLAEDLAQLEELGFDTSTIIDLEDA
jgi:hypothetical protein